MVSAIVIGTSARTFNIYIFGILSDLASWQNIEIYLISKKIQGGQLMNYSDYCSIQSYKGWLKYCDSYRLYNKYIRKLEKFKPSEDLKI